MDDKRLAPEDILTPTQLAKRLQVSLNWVAHGENDAP
jgi:hypothetical protein